MISLTSVIRPSGRLVAACLLIVCMSLGATLTARAQAPEGEALAGDKRCGACHHVENVLLGPTYRAIAARHTQERSVMADVLAQKIVHGGAGNWGVVPMVPNEHVSLDEARMIAQWILSLND